MSRKEISLFSCKVILLFLRLLTINKKERKSHVKLKAETNFSNGIVPTINIPKSVKHDVNALQNEIQWRVNNTDRVPLSKLRVEQEMNINSI
jgi:hypothetical protein